MLLYSFVYAEIIDIEKKPTVEKVSQSVKENDVKFIAETSLSAAQWDPGVSLINDTNQKLLDYNTEGLNLYSIKGKINIFDSDVLTIEKYGSFAGTNSQAELLSNYKKDMSEDSALEGLNISVKAFLLLKHFYLKDYKYLEALEYQYSTYKFSAIATNMIDTIFWYGPTTEGIIEKDFFPLSKDSTISFFTDFNEHRLYVLELVDLVKSLPINSIKVGGYSTNWLKPTYLGSTDKTTGKPIIHHSEFISHGITFDIMHKFRDKVDIGFSLNYGFDNYINYTSNSLEVDYLSYDTYLNFSQNIYSAKLFEIYAHAKAFMSMKRFNSSGHDLNSEDVKGVSVGFNVVF